jgi:hypothetical protein
MKVTGTAAGRFGPYVQTWSGRRFYPLDPRPEDFVIEDIAHHLSLINRFTGGTTHGFSVIQHSMNCFQVADEAHKPEALLHDGTEAYLGDISSPLKSILPDYKAIEANCYRVMAQKFNIPEETSLYVKAIDLRMLVTEANGLMKPDVDAWWRGTEYPDLYPLDELMIGFHPNAMQPADYEDWFLDIFNDLAS